MPPTNEELRTMLAHEQFGLSSKYDPQWVIANEMGPNVLWITEENSRSPRKWQMARQ